MIQVAGVMQQLNIHPPFVFASAATRATLHPSVYTSRAIVSSGLAVGHLGSASVSPERDFDAAAFDASGLPLGASVAASSSVFVLRGAAMIWVRRMTGKRPVSHARIISNGGFMSLYKAGMR